VVQRCKRRHQILPVLDRVIYPGVRPRYRNIEVASVDGQARRHRPIHFEIEFPLLERLPGRVFEQFENRCSLGLCISQHLLDTVGERADLLSKLIMEFFLSPMVQRLCQFLLRLFSLEQLQEEVTFATDQLD